MKNNATIENAYLAISLIGVHINSTSWTNNWDKTGGIVQASNSNFINNRKDIEFMTYQAKSITGTYLLNRSIFSLCKFLSNDNTPFKNPILDKLGVHVTMLAVNGVRFEGCTFQDLRTPGTGGQMEFNKNYGRIGIFTVQSSYFINNHCQIYPCTTANSKFINMNRAIESRSNGEFGIISIENTEFNSYTGVFLTGITYYPAVRSNTFNINHWVGPLTNTDFPFGLYLDKCNNFNIEGNQFTGNTISTNVNNGGNAGLVIRNTGAITTLFYRNNFDNLKMASQALSQNKGGDKHGLKFRCNDYENCFNDLDIRDDPKNPAPSLGDIGISKYQKHDDDVLIINPDNKFGNNSPIINFNIENKGNDIEYFYSGLSNSTNRLYPYKVTLKDILTGTFIVTQKPRSTTLRCPNNIISYGTDRIPLISKLIGLKPGMMAKVIQQKGLTDGGNTTLLMNNINNATTANVNTIVTQLLSFSPYLSDEVLALLSEKESPFTNTMITDVLLANPQSARSLWVQTNLDNRINPLPLSSRMAIDSLEGVYTHSDTLSWEVSSKVQEYDFNFTELMYSYLSDTNSNLQDFNHWLKHPVNPMYHYQLAEMYFENNDWANYLSVTDSIPIKFELNSNQQSFHTAFNLLYQQLHTWQLAGANLLEPDVTRKAWLLNYISNQTHYPARVYGLLAANDTLINQADVYVDAVPSGQGQGKRGLDKENNESLVNLYPNPAEDIVSLKWKVVFKASKVKVFDLNGKLITETEWNTNAILNLKVDTWPNGIYIINIDTGAKDIISRRLLINR